MKKIEQCEINELVRPIMDYWHSDGGGATMRQSTEYTVVRRFVDEQRRRAPYSWVRVSDGANYHFALNFGRYVIGKYEVAPTVRELLDLPQEAWVSGDGVFRERGINRERFMLAVEQSKKAGDVPARTTHSKSSSKKFLLNESSAELTMAMGKQARQIIRILLDTGRQCLSEIELEEVLNQQSVLKSTQKPLKVFNYYIQDFIRLGIITMRYDPVVSLGE